MDLRDSKLNQVGYYDALQWGGLMIGYSSDWEFGEDPDLIPSETWGLVILLRLKEGEANDCLVID
jgi:hypothetical protein